MGTAQRQKAERTCPHDCELLGSNLALLVRGFYGKFWSGIYRDDGEAKCPWIFFLFIDHTHTPP